MEKPVKEKRKGKSYAFLAESREAKRLREANSTKDYNDSLYNVKKTYVYPNPTCLVTIGSKPTVVK